MDGLPTREGQFCAAPICLLYVNGSDQLVPIAIQLKQVPGEDNPVFLPSDNWIDWILAKIYYQSASTQVNNYSILCNLNVHQHKRLLLGNTNCK